MDILSYLKERVVILDGGMGSLLQSRGLGPGEAPEGWNLTRPEEIVAVHKAYFDAGTNVVNTNTFGANGLKYAPDALEDIVRAAIANARTAAAQSVRPGEKFIALDIGPTGKLLEPFGTLPFEDAVEAFAKTVRLGEKYGADLIAIETMTDLYETKAALLAAKENSRLPVFVSNAYSENGRLLTGAPPLAVIAMLEGMGADAVGVNCSFGPETLLPVIRDYLRYASVPVLFKPNAGLPTAVNGNTVYDVVPADFAETMRIAVKEGVRLAGGCCGTTPEYISALCASLQGVPPVPVTEKYDTAVSSFSKAVLFSGAPVLIGERINPTGKKRLQEALRQNDTDYLLEEANRQEENGADVLDVNVGLPGIDEAALLPAVVKEIQTVTGLPLQLDSADANALERAMRVYNGKPMVNSVNGKRESMEAVFPLVKKYGGTVVALTLDENGIPDTAGGRLEIAQKIVKTAEAYGIRKKDIIADPLCMAVSAAPDAGNTALSALRLIRDTLGCKTVLGLSNVSFGLPDRDALNASFFAMAAENGLSAAIINPCSEPLMKAYASYRALKGLDPGFAGYLSRASANGPAKDAPVLQKDADPALSLIKAIENGLKANAERFTEELLKTEDPLNVIRDQIVPALNSVGEGFEAKRLFLPQLLQSAEAAGAAFERIKAHGIAGKTSANAKGKIVIATVKGDIHDIGKNIVKMLLENYGFQVIDLGKDVSPEEIAAAVKETNASLVGLSALMTTTVPAMRETIALLRKTAPDCRVMVGGAVLTEEYAREIGADYYGRDAMATVRIAQTLELRA